MAISDKILTQNNMKIIQNVKNWLKGLAIKKFNLIENTSDVVVISEANRKKLMTVIINGEVNQTSIIEISEMLNKKFPSEFMRSKAIANTVSKPRIKEVAVIGSIFQILEPETAKTLQGLPVPEAVNAILKYANHPELKSE